MHVQTDIVDKSNKYGLAYLPKLYKTDFKRGLLTC